MCICLWSNREKKPRMTRTSSRLFCFLRGSEAEPVKDTDDMDCWFAGEGNSEGL